MTEMIQPRCPLWLDADAKAKWKQTAPKLSRAGILSNVDLDLLQQTLDRLDVEFDLLVTAQQVRAYKPDHAHFLQARRSIGSSSWLHAAQSYFHDVVPATELGIPVAWINRHGEPPHGEARPDRNFGTLGQLACWLTTTG